MHSARRRQGTIGRRTRHLVASAALLSGVGLVGPSAAGADSGPGDAPAVNGVAHQTARPTSVDGEDAQAGVCHPAYRTCLPLTTDLDCIEIGHQVDLRDPAVDPYRIDDGVIPGLGCELYPPADATASTASGSTADDPIAKDQTVSGDQTVGGDQTVADRAVAEESGTAAANAQTVASQLSEPETSERLGSTPDLDALARTGPKTDRALVAIALIALGTAWVIGAPTGERVTRLALWTTHDQVETDRESLRRHGP